KYLYYLLTICSAESIMLSTTHVEGRFGITTFSLYPKSRCIEGYNHVFCGECAPTLARISLRILSNGGCFANLSILECSAITLSCVPGKRSQCHTIIVF